MEKKVLVIDDSALMRRVMSGIIDSDKHLTVGDTASNGLDALDLLVNGKRYDAILLDIQMPKMNGVEFIRGMVAAKIEIPILVVSSIASESASETIEALELGAFDFVKKPLSSSHVAFAEFRDNVLSRVYSMCGLGNHPAGDKEEAPEAKIDKESVLSGKRVQIQRGKKLAVVISSTGGPKALQSVIPKFPANFPYPLVVVQHMPANFTESLASRLNEMSLLQVKEAAEGDVLQRGIAYIAQGGKQCELTEPAPGKYVISENDKPPRGGLKPCADIFFESLQNISFEEIVCGVLTGMGNDGTRGIQLVKKTKEMKVVAQDEATSVVYGMPRAVKLAGVANEVVPLERVAEAMIKQIGV